MKLADFRIPVADDFPGVEIPNTKIQVLTHGQTFDMLKPVFEALKAATRALQRQLTFRDNFNCEPIEKDLKHNIETTIALETLRGAPRGVVVELVDGHLLDKFTWRVVDESRIAVTLLVATFPAPTTAFTVRMLVIGS